MSSIAGKLTQKQRRFIDEYIISGNATQAAIKAGYSKKYANTNAAKILQNTTIKAEIARRNAEIQSEKTADMTEVMEYLTSVMRGEQTESVDRIKAAELIGKRNGAWTDKKELSGDINIDIGVGDYDDDN